ncbi:MAG: WD40 repeat domain-containing protein, partial [Gemmataceae bacterium]
MNAIVSFRRWLTVAVMAGVFLATTFALAQTEPDAAKIEALIRQLADDDLATRKAAQKQLTDRGEEALEPLRKAVAEHPDPDVRLRALVITRAIEKASFGEIRRFTGHMGAIRHIDVSKDGKQALTGSMDQTARLWDIDTGKEIRKFVGHGSWVWTAVFSPDGKNVLTSGAIDKSLRLWTPEAKEVRVFEGHTGRVYGADFTPDGKYVASSGAESDLIIRLFDTGTGKEIRKFEGHTGWIWKIRFSPDGQKLASVGSNDKSFRIWDVATG